MTCRIARSLHLVIAVAFIVLPACEEGPPGGASKPTITLTSSSLDMVVGESKSFDIIASGASVPFPTFTVTPASVATVTSDGRTATVHCNRPGSAVITVSVVVNGQTLTATVPVTCRETTLMDVSPQSLAFSHTVGSTGCPQQVGTFRVTNTAAFAYDVGVVSLHSALTVDVPPTTFRLEPGAFRDVVVSFNCSTQTSFVGEINVALYAPARVESKIVTVTGTINR